MARILLRAHKDPFQVVSPHATYRKNVIGDNVGNLLFSSASYKLLHTAGTEVRTSRLGGGAAEADRINAEFDHVVIPLANAFRMSFQSELIKLTELIEALRIPVTVLGVGAQLRIDGDARRLTPMTDTVARFVGAVLDRSPSIGVRGEFTQQYLERLGFSDVEVIGCPSAYLRGPGITVEKRVDALTPESRVSLNISPQVRGLGSLITSHTDRYRNLRYTAQHRDALRMLLYPGHAATARSADHEALPTHRAHPLIAGRRTTFFVDPQPWMEYLAGFDFSFGTRIHGNMAAMLAGTPAYVLAHDSRTLELARYYDIPHRSMRDVTATTDAAELFAEADYSAFNRHHAERFDVFAAYLGEHGLRHVYEPGEDPSRFDRRIAATPFPKGIHGHEITPRRAAAALVRRLPAVRRPVPRTQPAVA